jgi:hypothetical protein
MSMTGLIKVVAVGVRGVGWVDWVGRVLRDPPWADSGNPP